MTETHFRRHVAEGPGADRPFSAMAITGFIFSLLWIGGVGSLVAVILSGVALRRARIQHQAGRGLAVAGLILGVLGLASTISWAILEGAALSATVSSAAGAPISCTDASCPPAAISPSANFTSRAPIAVPPATADYCTAWSHLRDSVGAHSADPNSERVMASEAPQGIIVEDAYGSDPQDLKALLSGDAKAGNTEATHGLFDNGWYDHIEGWSNRHCQ